jgi:putative transposase
VKGGGHLAILRNGLVETKESKVAAGDIVPVPGAQFEQTLASASPDMLREMVREFAQRMMDADVEVACNAGYGEVTPDRVNSRNGYRRREWDTRAGTIELAIPKLRAGSYFPSFLEHRRRAERALASVVATSYLLGVSTRRVEKLAASLGVTGLSRSQVSAMAAELDELVDSFRNRPLDRGPYTFCWIDALTQKVREGGRTVNVHCLIATGVNADGCREILGIDVTSSEDGAGWLAFLRGLAARGLSGVALVTSDDHAGLVNAIAAVLPGAAWQRCRTHYHRNLLTRVPKSAQPWVPALVRTIFEQPGPASVRAQHAHVVEALEAKLPQAAAHLDEQTLGPLADPPAHGGDPADAFHVVVPSLPGYGFSGKPAATDWDVHRIARAWAELMTRLGYERFLAMGSDWGTSISTSLALQHPGRLLASTWCRRWRRPTTPPVTSLMTNARHHHRPGRVQRLP